MFGIKNQYNAKQISHSASFCYSWAGSCSSWLVGCSWAWSICAYPMPESSLSLWIRALTPSYTS
jgi:hypothetical protein